MSDYPLSLAKPLIEKYVEDGFVVTPGVLNPSEIQDFGLAVDLEVSRRSALDTRAVSEKATYEQSFIQCMRLWETSREVRRLLSFRPRRCCSAIDECIKRAFVAGPSALQRGRRPRDYSAPRSNFLADRA